jgi:hypothetical protein
MTRLSFEEGRKEINLLLEAGKEEFDSGNSLAALSILFEAQFLLSELLQSELERVEVSGPIAVSKYCVAAFQDPLLKRLN